MPKKRGRPPKKQAEVGETGAMVKKRGRPGKRQTIEADVEMEDWTWRRCRKWKGASHEGIEPAFLLLPNFPIVTHCRLKPDTN